MMVAWAGMASSSYVVGRLFDATLNYNLSFILEGGAGVLNLAQLQATNRLAAVNRLRSYAEADPTTRSLN